MTFYSMNQNMLRQGQDGWELQVGQQHMHQTCVPFFPRLQCVLAMQEVVSSQEVGVMIATCLATGSFHLAMHYWLALHHQCGKLPSFSAQRALILACQSRGPRLWYPALFILTAMLNSQVDCPCQTF